MFHKSGEQEKTCNVVRPCRTMGHARGVQLQGCSAEVIGCMCSRRASSACSGRIYPPVVENCFTERQVHRREGPGKIHQTQEIQCLRRRRIRAYGQQTANNAD